MGTDHRAMAFRATSQLLLRSTPMLQAAAQQRTGLLGVKCGMLTTWDEWGMPKPLTIVKVDNCQVSQVKTVENEGYSALQLGAIDPQWAISPRLAPCLSAMWSNSESVQMRCCLWEPIYLQPTLSRAKKWMLRAPARGRASQA